jgi:hypothetical protein
MEESASSGESTPIVVAGPSDDTTRIDNQSNKHPDDIASLIGIFSLL